MAHTNRGIRSKVIPFGRTLVIVEIKLLAPGIDALHKFDYYYYYYYYYAVLLHDSLPVTDCTD